jgi:cytochrome c-type biogenesis protein CcmH/NrfG
VAKGDFDRAIQDFNEAIRLQPDAAEILVKGIEPNEFGSPDRC